MKKFSLYACTVALTCGATVLLAAGTVHRSQNVGEQPGVRMDAASHDGLFLGRCDADGGKRWHWSSGRWSDDAHRRRFVSGYLQGYREMYGQAASEEFLSSLADLHNGNPDGIMDRLRDRQQSMPCRASATENYRKADRLHSEDTVGPSPFQQFYREA